MSELISRNPSIELADYTSSKSLETADLYREGSGENSGSVQVIYSGALRIESFEGSSWRRGSALSMGILSKMLG